MTVTYGFYDSLSGDRKYNAIQMGRIFEGMITDGIYDSIGTGFLVSPSSGMVLSVGAGRAWFNFTWTLNDAPITVTIPTAEVALNRIDTVVLEVNSDTGTRANTIKVIKGTPASSPVAPTLSHTATLNQYGLANVAVAAGVTSIVGGNITNLIGTVSTPYAKGIMTSDQVASLTATLNGLTAGWRADTVNTWSYSSADSPTFVISVNGDMTSTISPGMRIKLTQTTVKYFIVTKVGTYTAGATLITVYGGTLYTLANVAITSPNYSREQSPFGFPLDPETWTVSVITSDSPSKASPTASTWYGDTGLSPTGPSISIPIGSWRVYYKSVVSVSANLAAVANIGARCTLSTANNSESDPEFSALTTVTSPISATAIQLATYVAEKKLVLAAKTTYYLNILTGAASASSLTLNPSAAARTVIKAVCAYL